MDAGKDGKEFTTDLGRRANSVFNQGLDGDKMNAFKTGIQNAVNMAKTPQEINELRNVAGKAGIMADRFNAIVSPSLLEGAPDWAKDVKEDKTFRGQDLTRFRGMTRDEAREQVMQERAGKIMSRANEGGRKIAADEQDYMKQVASENQNKVATNMADQQRQARIAEVTDPAYRAAEKQKNEAFQKSIGIVDDPYLRQYAMETVINRFGDSINNPSPEIRTQFIRQLNEELSLYAE